MGKFYATQPRQYLFQYRNIYRIAFCNAFFRIGYRDFGILFGKRFILFRYDVVVHSLLSAVIVKCRNFQSRRIKNFSFQIFPPARSRRFNSFQLFCKERNRLFCRRRNSVFGI